MCFINSPNNKFYHNNFVDNTNIVSDSYYSSFGLDLASVNKWDDGQGQGNYWSDYKARYPDASVKGIPVIGTPGIGNQPYFVKPPNYVEVSTLTREENKEHWNQLNALYTSGNVDHYPLMTPYPISPLPQFTNQPTPTQQSAQETNNESFLTTEVILTSAIAGGIVAIIVLLLIFKKKSLKNKVSRNKGSES